MKHTLDINPLSMIINTEYKQTELSERKENKRKIN